MALTRIQWAGKTYRFDMDSPTIGEMAAMREFTGHNWLPMVEEMREGNFMCLSAALWMMLNRSGEACNLGEAPWPEGKGPMDFYQAMVAGELVEPAGAADPNVPAADSIPNSPGSLPAEPASTSETSEPSTSTPSPDSASRPLLSTA